MPKPTTSLKTLLPLLLFLITGLGLWGQAYDIRQYSEEEGLDEKYIYSIIQDQYGFLWLGAGEGLVRYDGTEFKVFDQSNGIAEDFVTHSLVDDQGRIWFGHNSGGITLMEADSFRAMPIKEEIISTITGITQDASGNIWFSTQRNGLIKFGPDLQPEYLSEGFANMFVFSMEILINGDLLLGTAEGLKVFGIKSGSAPKLKYSVFETELTKIECIAQGHEENVFWVGTEDEGFFRFSPGKSEEDYQIQRFSPKEGYPVSKVPVIFQDLQNNVWVGTAGSGFRKYASVGGDEKLAEIAPLHPADSTYLEDIIASIYQDKFGQIWLGTYGNGLISMVEEMFILYQPQESEVIDNIHAVIEDSRGNLWFGTGNGLFMVNSQKIQDHGFHFTGLNGMPLVTELRYGSNDGLPQDQISSLFEDKQGNIWIGTDKNGLFTLDPQTGNIDSVFLSDLSLSKSINTLGSDQNGRIWVGTKGGAYIVDPETGNQEYYNTRNGLSHNNIYSIYTDSEGLVWIATHSNKVSVFDGRTFSVVPKRNDLGIPNIFAAAEGDSNEIWLATDGGGLFSRRDTHYTPYTIDSGLVSNYCYDLIKDQENNLWITHRNGLSRLITDTKKVIPFVGGDEFPLAETPINSVFRDKDGNIWFGTAKGVVKYNSFYDRFENLEPVMMITGFEELDQGISLTGGTTLDYGQYRIKIDFIGLTFVNQQFVEYQYRLNDLGWSEITDRNSVTYEGLSEGNYTFQVRARNKQGLWSEAPVELSFSIAPPFWKTWWFRILGLLVIAGIIYGYVRYRTYVLNKEKEILEERVLERTSELAAEKEKVEAANLELEKLSLVASETDNAVYILDENGYLEWVNEGFSRMTGFTQEEFFERVKGKTFVETSSYPGIEDLLEKVKQEKTSVSYESQLPTDEGEVKYVLSTLNAIFDEKGKIRKLVIIDSDITEQKLAEKKVQEMNVRLEEKVKERTAQLAETNIELEQEKEELSRTAKLLAETNKELDTFIYRASHDLKGPLASLVGLAEIAVMEVEDPVASSYLGLLEKGAKKLDKVLVDLLEATRVKQARIVESTIPVPEFLNKVIQDVRKKAETEEVDIRVNIQEDLEINSDRTILEALLFNFILNAIQYRDPKKDESFADVSVFKTDKETLRIEVKDNGTGIRPEHQGRVFDMFFRGTEDSKGSGLGLYTVRIASEKIGGSCGMESTEGEGSLFWAEIPLDIREYLDEA